MSKLDVVVPIRESTSEFSEVGFRTELQKNSQQKGELPLAPSQAADMPNHKEGSTRTLILCFAGIFVCYFYYGILQEKITRSDYGFGGTKERFTFFFCLVLVQCIINATFAKSVLLFNKQGQDTTSTKLYVLCALSYLGAMVASNSALKYVSYPFQVLGKSCKPIPGLQPASVFATDIFMVNVPPVCLTWFLLSGWLSVIPGFLLVLTLMILGVLLARKRYPLLKYFCVLLIVIGVATFVYKDGKASATAESAFGFGELLLVLSLTLDGLTGVAQEKMRAQHQTSSHHMMANVNLWSVLYLTITVIVTGEGIQFIEFVSRYPYVISNILTFGAASALGQHFIFVTVTTFGPLTCSIMTTTRKFFTILGSVILFSNPLLPRQWGGVLLVFAGLGLDSIFGKSRPSKAIK